MQELRFRSVVIACLVLSTITACSLPLKKKSHNSADAEMQMLALRSIDKPLPPEKGQELLGEAGANWWYGQGLGETALNVGAVVAFPPYAIYLLGNAALSLSGYEPIEFSNALPEAPREQWRSVYEGVTESPGRVTAAIAGEEFRSKERAAARIKEVLREDEQTDTKAP